MRSGERGGECRKEAAVRHGSEGRGVGGSSATIEGGEEAAARLWGALRRRQRQRQCGSGVGGRSAAPEGGEEAAARLWS